MTEPPEAPPDRRRETGAAGEQAVEAHLRALGYAIEARNWRCDVGELDVVASQGDLLVFVEVRSVTTDFLETPTLSVNRRKQTRVARAADAYLQARGLAPARVRFDVVGVRWTEGEARLEYVENAFVPGHAF